VNVTARRLEKRLIALVAQASLDFGLLSPHDRVLVAVSGGKDSLSMLRLLGLLARRTPFPFSFVAVAVDQGQPTFDRARLASHFEAEGYDYRIISEDTFSVVKEKIPQGQTYCSLCSRLRRGILYTAATRLGMTKVALGHHREDATETLLLNILYSGQLKAMPARLTSNDGHNTVIRPLIYCAEDDLRSYAECMGLPVLPCGLCSQQPDLKRRRVKRLIDELQADNPHVRGNLLSALRNVRTSHLLDPDLHALRCGGGSLARTADLEAPVGQPSAERGSAAPTADARSAKRPNPADEASVSSARWAAEHHD
jgi:tRNA 2-thiocytidine biosynthesis protein TtcA